jgi:hypothetical protein
MMLSPKKQADNESDHGSTETVEVEKKSRAGDNDCDQLNEQ